MRRCNYWKRQLFCKSIYTTFFFVIINYLQSLSEVNLSHKYFACFRCKGKALLR